MVRPRSRGWIRPVQGGLRVRVVLLGRWRRLKRVKTEMRGGKVESACRIRFPLLGKDEEEGGNKVGWFYLVFFPFFAALYMRFGFFSFDFPNSSLPTNHLTLILFQIYRHPNCLNEDKWEHTQQRRKASKFARLFYPRGWCGCGSCSGCPWVVDCGFL